MVAPEKRKKPPDIFCFGCGIIFQYLAGEKCRETKQLRVKEQKIMLVDADDRHLAKT